MAKQPRGLSSLQGQKVLIVGTGREGVAIAHALRGVGTVSWIRALDESDSNSATWVSNFQDQIPLSVWNPSSGPMPEELTQASVAIMSPGIPVTGALHRSVQALGIPMTSGTAMFVADHHDQMIGVTGSKGKSTTTTMIHHLMAAAGNAVALGGNMGIPVQGLEPASHYCVELSSYQCRYLEASPTVCVLTALFPEHLDWHGSLEEYYRDKLNLLAHNPGTIIANGDDQTLRTEVTTRFPEAKVTWVGQGEAWHLEADDSGSWLVHAGQRICHSSDIPLLGRHNHQNALMALAAASAATGIDPVALSSGFATFSPLPHRLEKIVDGSGLIFVNDSLATNPQAAAAALRALDTRDLCLIIGGKDRGVDYQPLIDQIVTTRPRLVVGLPESGPGLLEKCASALSATGLSDQVRLEPVASMEQAVVRARALMAPGSYVVLSPGAPSFGQYRDYEHRADDFRHWITETKKDTA